MVPHPSSTDPLRARRISRTRIAVRTTLVCFVLVALGFIAYLVAVTPPTPDSFYPKCVLYQATGIHCPGCGAGRAAHAVLNGQFLEALRFNVYALVAVPLLFAASVRWAWRWVTGSRPAPRRVVDARWIKLLLVAILLFWLLRNVPVYPFILLAPP